MAYASQTKTYSSVRRAAGQGRGGIGWHAWGGGQVWASGQGPSLTRPAHFCECWPASRYESNKGSGPRGRRSHKPYCDGVGQPTACPGQATAPSREARQAAQMAKPFWPHDGKHCFFLLEDQVVKMAKPSCPSGGQHVFSVLTTGWSKRLSLFDHQVVKMAFPF